MAPKTINEINQLAKLVLKKLERMGLKPFIYTTFTKFRIRKTFECCQRNLILLMQPMKQKESKTATML